jgi:outer membrane immunogenic protein
MKKLTLALIFVATGAVSATAADLPVKAPPPVVVPAISWTGIYVGANIGYAWSDSHWLTNHASTPGVGPCATGAFIIPCDPVDSKTSGFAGGGQLGARFQTGAWVFGVEGTWTGTKLNDTTLSAALAAIGLANTLSYDTNIRDIYTATGQVGYAWDRTLLYVKGGYAGGRLDLNSTNLPAPVAIAPVRLTANGWTIGAGFEYSVTQNLSVGAEYNHVRLNAGDVATCTTGIVTTFSCPAPPNPLRYTDIRTDIDQVLVRMNYRFSWLTGPVVAKY